MPPWLGNELQVTAEKQEQLPPVPALDARLLAAAAYVRRGALVADIGRAAWWRRIYAPHRWRVRARLWKSTGAGRQ